MRDIVDLAKKSGGTTEFIIEQECYQDKAPIECAEEDLKIMKEWSYSSLFQKYCSKEVHF